MWLVRCARLSVVLVVSLLVAAPGARAADDYVPHVSANRMQWGYVERHTPYEKPAFWQPTGSEPFSDVPVGSTGGVASRAFFAFETRRVQQARIISATLSTRETHANDCGARSVELWTTEAFLQGSTWATRPAELVRVASSGAATGGCLVDDAFDVTQILQKAADDGDEMITFELRVPDQLESDDRFGRRVDAGPRLDIVFNRTPLTPTDPWMKVRCEAPAPGQFISDPNTQAGVAMEQDPDGPQDRLTARIGVWPVDDPAQRQERTAAAEWGSHQFYLRQDGIEVDEGRAYAWSTRLEDGTDSSAWTDPCFFTLDTVSPDRSPAVTSEVYPEGTAPTGDIGQPGKFRFDANGVGDVAGYYYGPYWQETYIAADRLGGAAEIDFTPTDSGPQLMSVTSVDRAGNRSTTTHHRFDVRDTRPGIASDDYPAEGAHGRIGQSGEFRFTSGLPNPVEYLYRLDGGPELTVAAGVDGGASVTITPGHGGENVLSVRSRDTSGAVSAVREHRFVVDTAPVVGVERQPLVGVPSTVSLSPGSPSQVVEYEYWYLNRPEPAVVRADAEGKATYTWVPTRELSPFQLSVRAKFADGTYSPVRYVPLELDLAAPTVSYTGAQRPGVPAVFTARTTMPGVTEWFWRSGAESGSVAPQADGSGVITWTPPDDGFYPVEIWATNATGALSGATTTSLSVSTPPEVTSTDYPENQYAGGVGVPGTFTLRPNPAVPTVTEYVYSYFDGLTYGPEQTVAAGADGSATVTVTPVRTGYNFLVVRSKSVDGSRSGERRYAILVPWWTG